MILLLPVLARVPLGQRAGLTAARRGVGNWKHWRRGEGPLLAGLKFRREGGVAVRPCNGLQTIRLPSGMLRSAQRPCAFAS